MTNQSNKPNKAALVPTTSQPIDAMNGLEFAYSSLYREFHKTTETIIAIPIRQYVQTGIFYKLHIYISSKLE